MNYWLAKSEPDVYGYHHLEKDKKTIWEGVRNYQARNNLKAMKENDLVLFYHSNIGKEVVGIAKVVKEHYPDPTADSGEWVVVEMAPYQKLKKAVTLETIKKHPELQQLILIKNGRLSVMPLKKEEFDTILQLSES
ncbi:MAG: EVE domain-containing protein [Cytophagales bacterium]|nr:EVE domain-containing protein [Cytophagales bacterium]